MPPERLAEESLRPSADDFLRQDVREKQPHDRGAVGIAPDPSFSRENANEERAAKWMPKLDLMLTGKKVHAGQSELKAARPPRL
jgi:hypothetical protein